MKNKKICLKALVVPTLLVASALYSMPAFAKNNGKDYDDWRLECTTIDEAVGKQCSIFQKIAAKEDKKVILAVAFVAMKENNKVIQGLRLITPLNVELTKKITLSMDSEKSADLPYQVCRPGGCIVAVGIDESFIERARKAKMMHVTYTLFTAKPTSINVSLKGFTAAFEALMEKAKK